MEKVEICSQIRAPCTRCGIHLWYELFHQNEVQNGLWNTIIKSVQKSAFRQIYEWHPGWGFANFRPNDLAFTKWVISLLTPGRCTRGHVKQFGIVDALYFAACLPLRCAWQGLIIIVVSGFLYNNLPVFVDVIPILLWLVSVIINSSRMPSKL